MKSFGVRVKRTDLVAVVLACVLPVLLSAQPNTCKRTLMPETINRFQPTTVPVMSEDGSILFLDRKFHPDNGDGPNDPDDVWFVKREPKGRWTMAERWMPTASHRPDVILALSADGLRALVFGKHDSITGEAQQCIAMARRLHPDSMFTEYRVVRIPGLGSIDASNENFYGTISDDASTIILALKRPGGVGDLDLYVSLRCGDAWSSLESLGPVINTAAFEGAPFIGRDRTTLYFASSREGGRGKSDLYMARRMDSTWTSWSEPRSLGTCINTQEEENAIWVRPKGDSIIFVSWDVDQERNALFTAELAQDLRPGLYCLLTGRVIDNATNQPVPDATVSISSPSRMAGCEYVEPLGVGENGEFRVAIPQRQTYGIIAGGPYYTSQRQRLGIRTLDSVTPLRLTMRLYDTRIPLASLYFERGTAELSDSAVTVLTRFAAEHGIRAMDLKIVGYTDMVGSLTYNRKLSAERASAVTTFLSERGVDARRMTSRGEGIEPLPSRLGMLEHPKSRRVDIFPVDPTEVRFEEE
jgi:outer membrane protein OmpA-like peptidoglycan-associated protein